MNEHILSFRDQYEVKIMKHHCNKSDRNPKPIVIIDSKSDGGTKSSLLIFRQLKFTKTTLILMKILLCNTEYKYCND